MAAISPSEGHGETELPEIPTAHSTEFPWAAAVLNLQMAVCSWVLQAISFSLQNRGQEQPELIRLAHCRLCFPRQPIRSIARRKVNEAPAWEGTRLTGDSQGIPPSSCHAGKTPGRGELGQYLPLFLRPSACCFRNQPGRVSPSVQPSAQEQPLCVPSVPRFDESSLDGSRQLHLIQVSTGCWVFGARTHFSLLSNFHVISAGLCLPVSQELEPSWRMGLASGEVHPAAGRGKHSIFHYSSLGLDVGMFVAAES